MTVACPHCGKDIVFDPAATPIERQLVPQVQQSKRDPGRYVLKCQQCGTERTFPVSETNSSQ